MIAYNDDILHDYHVIHDSGANCGIFKNINIHENIRISNETATIKNGIGGNLTTNVIGTFNDRHASITTVMQSQTYSPTNPLRKITARQSLTITKRMNIIIL